MLLFFIISFCTAGSISSYWNSSCSKTLEFWTESLNFYFEDRKMEIGIVAWMVRKKYALAKSRNDIIQVHCKEKMEKLNLIVKTQISRPFAPF